mgnify:CR=1 FL=1
MALFPTPRPTITNGRIQFHRLGLRRAPWRDLYHELLTASWPLFIGGTAALYVITTVLFAGLYLAGGDCYGAGDATGLRTAVAFSMHTLTTIGYGTLAPTTPWAEVVAMAEAFVGLLGVGLFSGLCFAKFGRPDARMAFARNAVITLHDGQPTLVMRLANERNADIVDASAHLYALRDVITEEGERMRRFYRLEPQRDHTPVFAMSWMIMHTIEPGSPLDTLVVEGRDPDLVSVVLTVTGTDATFMQTVYGQAFYPADELRVGHRFVDIITSHAGMLAIDHGKLHDTLPDPAWPR